jgi:hypothetical protein
MDDLQKEWNKILKEEGLPKIRGSEKLPVDIVGDEQGHSAIEVLQSMNDGSREELENLLEKFELLSTEAERSIFNDLEKARDGGMPPGEILELFKLLILTIDKPDDKKAPKPPAKTDKEAEDFARGKVEKMFDRMQRIIEEREKKDKEERKDTIN